MIEHDVTEFTAIVKRYGLCNESVETFVKAAKQEKLKFDEAAPESSEEKSSKPKRGLAAVPPATA